MTLMIDLIVTRKIDDPTHYRDVVSCFTEINLIELPYASSCTEARRQTVHFGNSDYVMWFDPDDTLYELALQKLIAYLKFNKNSEGVMCLSDYIDPIGKVVQINTERLHIRPLHGHFLKIIRRDVLIKILENCSDDLICWQVSVYAMSINIPVLPFSGYLWNVNKTKLAAGLHTFSNTDKEMWSKAKTKIDLFRNNRNRKITNLKLFN